ncbi:fumarylacetoacetate hydrolase family protein [Salinibacterium sp. NSLL150]|uniref:fumarylacetoacetate hydrolase family protein n=1 Tax=unclassified Salinibacterium TaxID=2632331 RepID=UPI0018CF2BCA|nr:MULTISPECIES: fumarylacetoacetate hydrolase family protein [unclassified Salinibacterium]MBH0097541.1 fumarylacetoacetate hydrolase family protein [Salinibacterium sp. NSLL35]MBH0100296.1 fumarylacetoacetate hydrolase family protein [Salinibacterium sp. NSLL150]MBH0103055.1 fumarylacetoacetate hydrolase family protein [Salinibacterium sp. NSLL16]MBH0105816.1 fumarylacetoacetate hydrolase family protein [Salinibacterium sp. NSLL17]
MRFARLGPVGSEIPVVLHDGAAFDLRPIAADVNGAFFESGGVDAARAAIAAGTLPAVETEGVRVGAAIAQPGKIVCVGLNYSDHAEETGATLPDEPVIFMKDPSTMVGAFDNVLIPRTSVKTDWEVELGVVIGATARYLDSPDDAAAVIAGYAVSHDVSERAFQLERGGTWDKGKSCETFNPFGPELVTADEVSDPQALGLRLWVNGVERQNGTTANMAFGVHYVVWYLSQFMVLRPGDVINTGTPAGVAMGIEGQPYLRAGDVVELEIDGLGRARQEMVQA